MAVPPPIDLSVREPASRLLDEPFALRARADDRPPLTWRARFRDDDGRVWKSVAGSPAELSAAWQPAKPHPGLPALQSLRPVRVDVRVEAEDGRAAGRQLTRLVLAEGVKPRRWRDGVAATLYLPADPVGTALLLDATGGEATTGAEPLASPSPSPSPPPPLASASPAEGRAPSPHVTAVAPVAAALLASRGVLTLAVTAGDVDAARERLAAVPSAPADVLTAHVVVPPNVGGAGDAAAWDALLEHAGARPRAPA